MQVVFMLVFQNVVFTAQDKEAGNETLFSRITMEKKTSLKGMEAFIITKTLKLKSSISTQNLHPKYTLCTGTL